ncbi:MAG TPA: hypothetical protein VL551_04275 [Actinospica sp.]|jgi:hypothetical protein|nr:hypothetical protein [Actinospica sp.]
MDTLEAANATTRQEMDAPDPLDHTLAVERKLERLGTSIPSTSPGIEATAHVEKNDGVINLLNVVLTEALKLSHLGPAYLDEVHETFAEPGESFDQAYNTLCGEQRFVVLKLRPDSGTKTAAIAMIRRLVLEMHVESKYLLPHGPTGLPTAALATERCHAFLMDLSKAEESRLTSGFGRDLKAASAILADANSYLIVLAEAEQWARISDGVERGVLHELQAPGPESVARKWVAAKAPGCDVMKWFGDRRIAGLLQDQSPREAVEIAKLICAALSPEIQPERTATAVKSDSSAADTDFQVRVASVVDARRQWRPQLLDWHREPKRTAFERNFLLVAAVLREFPVGAVFKEAKYLSEQFKDVGERMKGQSGPGVIELLHTIGAPTDPGGKVRFSRPRWAEAVVDYYWSDRPDGHDAFISWLIRLPLSRTFQDDERATVANRVLEVMFGLIMTKARVNELEHVIDQWSAQPNTETAAWDFLDAAALHHTLGRQVAQLMLRWTGTAHVRRRKAVAAVCGRQFGRTNTGKALVRLRRLVADEEPEVAAVAERALVALWEQPDVGRELLEHLVEWQKTDVADRVVAARNIFGKIAALRSRTDPTRPDLLVWAVANDENLSLVAEGWRCLLEGGIECDPLVDALRPWLAMARDEADVEADVMSVFERAISGRRRAAERLERAAQDWRWSTGDVDQSPAGRLVRRLSGLTAQEPVTTMFAATFDVSSEQGYGA